MLEFWLAGAVFLIAHSLPSIRPLRAGLQGALGRRGYLAAYSAMSLALLAWLISAALTAPYVGVWTPPVWAYHQALVTAPLGLTLVVWGLVRPNPWSIGFAARGFDPARPGLVGVTRHPVLWGFALWAFAHVPPNGDLVSVALFGALGGFSLAGFALVDRRTRRALGAADWQSVRARAPLLPFAGGWPRFAASDLAGLSAGVALSAALLGGLHAWLFGVSPLTLVG
jgi:uncharacterized membrane protein